MRRKRAKALVSIGSADDNARACFAVQVAVQVPRGRAWRSSVEALPCVALGQSWKVFPCGAWPTAPATDLRQVPDVDAGAQSAASSLE